MTNKNEVKTLADQMEEYSNRKEKVEQLKKELLVNKEWDIYYDEDDDDYLIKDLYGQTFPIDVNLREFLPNSYFHSPECDEEILGYDPFTGAIVYDLWKVGRKEMLIGEGIYSDFHDTGYGIGRLLTWMGKDGYGDKVPPIHILPQEFIPYHSDLQGSLYHWGDDIQLINCLGFKEYHRNDCKEHINKIEKDLKENGDGMTDDVLNGQLQNLEWFKKRLADME